MTIRENLEQWEKIYLSPYATLSMNSKGRAREEEQCDIRPVLQRDRDRIIHSKSCRRLKDKTQVFLSPEGDHYRTRLTHTLEVSQNARTIAKALQLNEELVEAIALGHDLGHTPFGHAGERALDEISPYGFKHNEQSVRTVRLSDKIAYTYHDMDDAIRAGILKSDDVPREIGEVVGYTPRERLNHFIHDIVTQSKGKDDICMSPEVDQALKALRRFMFDAVYSNPIAKSEEHKAEALVKTLYEHYMEHPDGLPKFFLELSFRGEPREQVVCDYISSMTDRFAIAVYDELYIPKCWMGY